MRIEETCSCGASIVIVDNIREGGFNRESPYEFKKRINGRIEDWRKNHNHDIKRKKKAIV